MGHFRTLYIKEDTTLEKLVKIHGKNLENYLEEEFMSKYCNCCGEMEPEVMDVCECAGLVGNVIPAKNGIKAKWDKTNTEFLIANITDMDESQLDKLLGSICDIAINKNNTDRYLDEYRYTSNYQAYIERLKSKAINAVIIVFGCKS